VLGGAASVRAASPAAAEGSPGAARPTKTLRYAFPAAETGFDPAQVADLYSRTVTAHIFEAPYEYDHLARPARVVPATAAAMPEVSDDFRSFRVRLRPGTLFSDDPAFGGQPRELLAADYVYSYKRVMDPAWKSPAQSVLEEQGIVGLAELRAEALQSGRFDYDRDIEGLRALDRYTLQVKLREPRPRFVYTLAAGDVFGAVAREVVERYRDAVPEHPVGTGPFVLKEWRRSSRLVLERNPRHRERFYDAQPAPDDAEGQALLARFRGRRLPMIDRVELSIIDEPQPRWLAFLNAEHDVAERVPPEYAVIAAPGGTLAPNLAGRGVRLYRVAAPDVSLTIYNMEHPVLGGYAPERIALRRALNLAIDVDREIRLPRREQAIAAQSMVQPGTLGYDPQLRTEMSRHDLARARALLDLYGYVDRDGDGWRERPDGAPLLLELSTQSDQATRQIDEIWKQGVDALGVRVQLRPAQWPENLKAVRNGRFTMWRVVMTAASPDGQGVLELCYGPSVGNSNMARFRLDAFDTVYRRLKLLPDGAERSALFREANKLTVAYAPYRFHVHRLLTHLAHPWVVGYRQPPFWQGWWHWVDVEPRGAAQAL
jgi:ABC-type transport system substrate-binding protein